MTNQRGLYDEHGKPLPIRTQEEWAMDVAKKAAARLTNETAGYLIPPTAIARQWAFSSSSPRAGRSLDAFLKSPIGKKSMEQE